MQIDLKLQVYNTYLTMINYFLIHKRVAIIGATLFTVMAYIMGVTESKTVLNVVGNRTGEIENFNLTKPNSTDFEIFSKISLPASLKGTHHGVALTTHQDSLVITASLKDLFDYYLSTSGEESIEQISRRVTLDLSSQLKGLALEQALVIWKDYISYKTALVDFDQQYSADTNTLDKYQHLELLQQRQLSLMALQDQIFSTSVAQILFSFDRQLDNHTLEKARVLASDLADEAKQQSLINLNAQLPVEITISMKRNQQQKLLLEIDTMEGLTAVQRYDLRAHQVGEAAANRLQLLDDKRLLWEKRIEDFSVKKQQLLDAELAETDYLLSLDKLYQQFFAPAELLRAKALTQ